MLALLATVTNNDLCLIVAIVLFVVAGVMSVIDRAFVMALVSVGLAFLALAFLVNP